MHKHSPPCNDVNDLFIQTCPPIAPGCPDPNCPLPPKPEPRPKECIWCGNLVQNPSFETDLSCWVTDNVNSTDVNPFEGIQAASMGPGLASMFQDVSLAAHKNSPLFFSFNAQAGSDNTPNGNLTAELLWLDENHNTIGTGLRMFIPNNRINTTARITFYNISDLPPVHARFARIQFSKAFGGSPDFISIDQVVLAAITSINLVQNPGFELGLTNWTADPDTVFVPSFSLPLEGAAQAVSAANGILFQDVPVDTLPARSSYLLSFAASVDGGSLIVSIQVQWLDAADDPIGSGLNLLIPPATLSSQGNYLSYLEVTDPAPPGTAKARIIFSSSVLTPNTELAIDQVIFARVITNNLVVNPSFENGLNDWTPVNTTLFMGGDVYEGMADARVATDGGTIFQDVPLPKAVGHCFLFNCGLGFRRVGSQADFGKIIGKIIWLNKNGQEIGIGLGFIIGSSPFAQGDLQWMVYNGITEPAPPGTKAARIQFTKQSATSSVIEIDLVVLARLI